MKSNIEKVQGLDTQKQEDSLKNRYQKDICNANIATIDIFDINQENFLGKNQYFIADLEVSNNGKLLAAINTRGIIFIWDLDRKTLIETIEFSDDRIWEELNNFTRKDHLHSRFYYSTKKKYDYRQEEDLERLLKKIKRSRLNKNQKTANDFAKQEILDLVGSQCHRILISNDSRQIFAFNGYSILSCCFDDLLVKDKLDINYYDFVVDKEAKIAYLACPQGIHVVDLTSLSVKKTLDCFGDASFHLIQSLHLDETNRYLTCKSFKLKEGLEKDIFFASEYQYGYLIGKERGKDLNAVERLYWKLYSKSIIKTTAQKFINNISSRIIVWDTKIWSKVVIKDMKEYCADNRMTALFNPIVDGLFFVDPKNINKEDSLGTLKTITSILHPAVNLEIQSLDNALILLDNDKKTFHDIVYFYSKFEAMITHKFDSKSDVFSGLRIDYQRKLVFLGCSDSKIKIINLQGELVSTINTMHMDGVTLLSNCSRIGSIAAAGKDNIISVWSYTNN